MADPLLDLIGVSAPQASSAAPAQPAPVQAAAPQRDPLLDLVGAAQQDQAGAPTSNPNIPRITISGVNKPVPQAPKAPLSISDLLVTNPITAIARGLANGGAGLKNSPVGGFVRGARDIVDGGAQLLAHGLEAIAPAGSDLETWARNNRQNVERINQNAEQDYKQNWRQGQPAGIDPGRIAGGIVASLPIAAAVPGAGAAALMPRIGASIGAGAISGAMQPIDTGADQSGDFWAPKLGQAAIGGVTGAAAPIVGDMLGSAASGISNRVRSVLSRVTGSAPTDAAVAQTVSDQMASRGVDFSRLAQETQDSLLADAKNALAGGGNLNFDALARRADFEAAGIKPTLGQLTRDPMQYQFEQNTRGITGAGEGLSQRFNQQNAQLIDAVNKARAGAQGIGTDSFSAADRVMSSLRDLDAARNAGVDQLYSAARDQVGINTPLNPPRFAQSVNDALDQAMVGDALPGGIRSAVNQIAKGDMPFTIQKAEQIRQAINGQMSNMPSRENVAMRIVNNALQDEIDRVGSASGQQAGDAFKAARAAASARFNALDSSAPLQAAVNGAAPDDFMRKFVISGKAADLLSLRADLAKQPQLWGEVRGQVIDWMKDRALNGATDEYGKFSQSAYNKAVGQIGDAKLKVLFSPDEIAQIKRLGRVASAIQVQPTGSAVNNSGTSQAVANLVSKASNVPYVKEWLVTPAKNFVLQGKVNSALNPSATSPILQPSANSAYPSPEVVRGLQLPFAVGGYPAIKGLLE